MSINLPKKKYYFLIFTAVFLTLVSFLYVYFNGYCFLYKPYDKGPQISSPVFYKVVENGDQYYIDQGNYRLIGINKDGKCKWTYINTSACYKELAQAPDGKIYATNYQYLNEATISNISIDEFSKTGKFLGSVYSDSYTVEHLFEKTSQIMDLQFLGHTLTFVTRTDDEVLLYSIDLKGNKKPQITASVPWDDTKEHAIKYCYDHEKGFFYVITAVGNIYEINQTGSDTKLLSYQTEEGFNIPYSMALVDGYLAVSDIGSRTVKLYDGHNFHTIATMKKNEDFFADPALYYSIARASQNDVTIVSGYATYRLNVNTKTITQVNTEIAFSTGEHVHIMFTWICGLFLFLMGLSAVIGFAIYYYKRVGFTDFTYNFMVIIIVVAISALVIVKYTDVLYNAYQDRSIDKISSIGNLIAKNISAEDVKSIDDLEDINSQSYKNIINFLNNNASNPQNNVFYVDDTGLNKKDNLWNADIYFGINKFFDNRIYFILSMPEEAGAIYPLEVAEKNAINLICQNNTLVYPDYMGYFGSYCLVQVPIVSDTNEVVGAVEVGFNKNSFIKEMRAKQMEIIISTAVVLLLSLLLLKEIFFGIKMFFAKKSAAPGELIDSRSVRTPIFLGQTAYHLSVVCGPLFAMQLYNETFGVSKEIAVAIAYSVTLLFVGISAFASGVLIKKISLHKLLVIGTIFAIVGELTAATSGGLAQFIVGRSLFGSGAGMILNILDTMVAMQPDEERVTQGFTMSSAGTNAGTIVGVALGATIITSLGYRWVYAVSAFILLILLITAILFYNKNNVPDAMNYVEVNSDMSFFHFVRNKRVIGYIFFLTMPYFICMGFIDFFLPLEGKSQGLNEEAISYIIIIFGLISIYLGPVLTKKLLSILDSYIVLMISAVVMSTAIIYYGIFQSVFALVLACVAIAFADSFFQSVQNIYFTQLPESIKYGQSSTLALSNVVIGIAQMGQAYLFAFAMFFGIRKSFLSIGICFLVLTAIFLILNYENRDCNKSKKITNDLNH